MGKDETTKKFCVTQEGSILRAGATQSYASSYCWDRGRLVRHRQPKFTRVEGSLAISFSRFALIADGSSTPAGLPHRGPRTSDGMKQASPAVSC